MKKRQGLTLIEVVVSIALIGMVAVVFLTIFNTGNKNIFKAGERTDDILEIQKSVDKLIETENFDKISDERVKETTVYVDFSNDEIDINKSEAVNGYLITIPGNKDGVEITTFVSHRKAEDNDERK